ncbi:hypothetical protein CABS01_01720 [Colletotrichum abscissum]|uniref:HNH nuclease domain-containing protein n=2 Tax=Colletotrichum acutatum species complex TaxID=2707335 RepID=A0A9P9X9I9_9PEZI|nr:uncharacterized protein CCOS01_06083 [Colletotrichum costaricense]XP_060398289.1 uncharacterized protein CABS01_01720 [Colletotrichum abscissum]KAI3543660.1 hypothetical protein CABS02_09983 [Colletotrichum abscissum]KAK1495913.1 hypothetical protein CABS01_01720 [Colletotrichum abscissum]KAK1530980.1 hypothetical protein CCOS01_06083 [Colletotrichum costaricense]
MASQSGLILPTVLSSVVSHPLSQQQLDDSQSEHSSALTDPEGYAHLWESSDKILEFYGALQSDPTVDILITFRQMLSHHGATALMGDIMTIGRDKSQLKSFSRYLINTILKPMKLAGVVRSSASSTASPSPGAAASIAQLAATVQPSDRRLQSTLKSICLKRDGYRCTFSHVVDRASSESRLVVLPVGVIATPTQLSHVLPLALRKFDNASPAARDAVAGVWYALYRYFPELEGKIGPDNLNQYENLITFESTVHELYDSHRLAFDPIQNRPNEYRIVVLSRSPLLNKPPQGHREIMTLISSDNSIPLPEPEFFKVHHRIAKILDVSGIGARIEAEIEDSQSDPENLSPDGSTDLESILFRKMLINV